MKNSQNFQSRLRFVRLWAVMRTGNLGGELYSSRQEIRQRLSLSLAEITSMLDQTKEQVDALRNNI